MHVAIQRVIENAESVPVSGDPSKVGEEEQEQQRKEKQQRGHRESHKKLVEKGKGKGEKVADSSDSETIDKRLKKAEARVAIMKKLQEKKNGSAAHPSLSDTNFHLCSCLSTTFANTSSRTGLL